MEIDVLGTKYTVEISDVVKDPALERCDGYCDNTTKKCIIDVMNNKEPRAKKNMGEYQKKVIRHELVHAFLFESGLAEPSWAGNEEIVDWIANQFPKMQTAFEEAGAL